MEERKEQYALQSCPGQEGEPGPEEGWQGPGVGLSQQELLVLEWDRHPGLSPGWGSLLPRPGALGAGKGRDQEEGVQGKGWVSKEGKPGSTGKWGLNASALQEPPELHICSPSASCTALNQGVSPPADLSLLPVLNPLFWIQPCFLFLLLLLLLLPGAPGAVAVAQGIQMGGFLSQEQTPPAGLFSHRNVYHKTHLYFIFTQRCSRTPRGKPSPAKSELLPSLKQILHLSHSPQGVMSLEEVSMLRLVVVGAINIPDPLAVQLGAAVTPIFLRALLGFSMSIAVDVL